MPTEQRKWAPGTIIAVLGSVSVMLVAVFLTYRSSSPRKVQTAVRVVDFSTQRPIPHAQISFIADTGSPIVGLTDENGLSLFDLIVKKTPSSFAHLRITADGYDPEDLATAFGSLSEIPLRPKSNSVTSQSKTETKALDAFSGEGASWGPLYQLCSDPLPYGYRIAHAEFHLAGDRQCGAWAECRETEHNDSHVCWQFRLQGRGEGSGDHQTHGRGEIVATLEKLDQSFSQSLPATQTVCHFYGQASQGAGAWNHDDVCTIPSSNQLDVNYRQNDFVCCGGGASSPTNSAAMPPGIELRVTGGHYWSVANPRIVGDKFYLHTYCGPAGAPGPGCNVDVEVVAHYHASDGK